MGVELPRHFKDAKGEHFDFIRTIAKENETVVGPYKPTGGGSMDILWTKFGDAVMLRDPNGRFWTLFKMGEGAATAFPKGL